jgi:endonuclease G
MSSSCPCSHGRSGDFDARTAYLQLSRKYEKLAQLFQRYLSNEGVTDATARLAAASEISGDLTTIVGGVPSAATDFAHCCVVGSRPVSGAIQWFCSGVLIHPRVVVTAAHCIIPGQLANVVALRAASIFDLAGANLVRVRRIIVHPQYPPSRRENDIAVLILRRAAEVAPAVMATTAEVNASVDTTLVGFGNTDFMATHGFGRKRQVTVPIVHLRRNAQDDLDDAEDQLDFESDSEFVAGGGGFDSCTGDSGGPAYIGAGNTLRVAGLTSRGIPSETACGEGGVYTRLDVHAGFIRQAAQQSGIQI